tara:strand:+ start:450 stop:773 length:324 start_codon:yes stop_codon:yes gene_type:complete
MKKLITIAALLLGGALQASTVKITVQQPKATKSWFMPTNINGFTTNTIGNTVNHLKCDTTVKDSHFQLICRQKGMIVLVYQDNTPQKDAILATPKAIVTIITVREEK